MTEIQNGVGYRTPANRISWGQGNLSGIEGRKFESYGGNRNDIVSRGRVTILHMTGDPPRDNPAHGDMALAVRGGDVTAAASWDDILAQDFADDGRLAPSASAGPSPAGQTVDGALASHVRIPAGQRRSVTFLLTWHFPNGTIGPRPARKDKWFRAGRMYANWWSDSLDVLGYLSDNLDELTNQTRAYHDALYETNLPYWMLDRISSQVAILRSQTCFWDAEGYFGGWEGCRGTSGCCMGKLHARLALRPGARPALSVDRPTDARGISVLSK